VSLLEVSAEPVIDFLKEPTVVKVSTVGRPMLEYRFALQTGEPLDLCYGVAVWDGTSDAAQIEQTCQQWQKLNQ